MEAAEEAVNQARALGVDEGDFAAIASAIREAAGNR